MCHKFSPQFNSPKIFLLELQAWLGPLTMSVFMTGVMFGAFVMGNLADKIGRKRTLFICLTNMLVLNTISGMVPSYLLHVMLKFLVGFFQAGYVLTSFVLANELIGASWRGIVGNGIQVLFYEAFTPNLHVTADVSSCLLYTSPSPRDS